jgi:hypothetical protein
VVLQQAPTAASCNPSRGGGLWAAALALGVTAVGGIFCCFRAFKVKDEVRLTAPLSHHSCHVLRTASLQVPVIQCS